MSDEPGEQVATTTSEGDDALLREYSRLAARYDRRWSFYVASTVRRTIRRLGVGPQDRVLDVGCGTGALLHAISLLQPKTRLAGVDASSDMLAVARRRLGEAVELKQGWARDLPFRDEQFDVVVSASVFHYVREPQSALAEMGRVLRHDGRLVITDWCDEYLGCRMLDVFLKRFNKAHYRIYSRHQLRDLMRSAGFTDVRGDRFRIDWVCGMMTVTARRPGDSAIKPGRVE